jgi:hypothetical protein
MHNLISQKCFEKDCGKNYKNHLKSNNYEVCTAVACCFPNILDVMVLENIYHLQILNVKW